MKFKEEFHERGYIISLKAMKTETTFRRSSTNILLGNLALAPMNMIIPSPETGMINLVKFLNGSYGDQQS